MTDKHREDRFIMQCRKDFGALTWESELLLRYGFSAGAQEDDSARRLAEAACVIARAPRSVCPTYQTSSASSAGAATPLTADTIMAQDLRDLFARHCECRPLDLERDEDDHAAIHDCDTAILHDVQVALGIIQFNDIGQAIREARGRCAAFINAQRRDT